MWHDAHLHLRDDLLIEEMKRHDVYGIVNAASPQEYAQIKKYQNTWNRLVISAGIHPWNVTEHSWEDMEAVMKAVNIIGEIGLDSVWCKTPLNLQLELFEKSLAYASEEAKPVILHLKGMEKEALTYVKRYPNTYLIHWYSCFDYVQAYMDLDCYFTIGPSVGKDDSVTELANCIPLNRMLIETDGIEAIRWCDETSVEVSEYVSILARSCMRIANLRGSSTQDIQQATNQNYRKFLNKAGIESV